MTKIFKVPFATQGDRTSIPDEVQADGAVSYTQGYSYDYERDQQTDPAAKDIEREKMNGIFHDITEAVGELQSFGFPKWATEGKPYPIRAIVYHKNKTWQSKIENNNDEPVTGTAWQELKADLNAGDINVYNKTESDQRFQPLGNYLPAGYSYSKAESDTNYQPKGNYAPAGNYALKGESYTKVEGDERYQPKGSYQPSGDYATNSTVNSKFDAANSNANNRVPNTRKVNGKQLNADISLTAGDVGAYTKAESDTRIADAKAAGTNAQNTANAANTNANGRVPSTRKVNNKALSADISLNAGDVGAYTKAEVDSRITASGGKSTASKTQSGWWKCGDTGMIIQWGRGNLSNETMKVIFPIAFPNECLTVSATNVSNTAMSSVNLSTLSRTECIIKCRTDPTTIRWMAIGY
ncbi:gp53-like domain-containing protein [Providencia rettgeri]|uniref:gp53-like domain-containing protein n=1 Tax=Providencia rettgeri TaxID=587 RepID=UPI00201230C1|nr:phage tail protein [Providencia rettgeri]